MRIERLSPAEALARFATAASDAVPSAGNRPLRLEDPKSLWYVERGSLEVFAVETEDGAVRAPLQNVLRLERGQLAFGIDTGTKDGDLQLLCKGLPDTRLRRLSVAALVEEAREDAPLAAAVAEGVDAWVDALGQSLVRDIETRPRIARQLSAGEESAVEGVVSARQGVVWVPCHGLAAVFLDLEDADSSERSLIPLTQGTWMQISGPSDVACLAARELETGPLLCRHLPEFHRLAARVMRLNRQLRVVDQANLQFARSALLRRAEVAARGELHSLLGDESAPPDTREDGLRVALRTVSEYEGIDLQAPETGPGEDLGLADFLAHANVRARRIRLRTEPDWWRSDSGAMLAFLREGDRPVALIPDSFGAYRVHDPASGRVARAGPDTVDALHEDAWFLYRTIPKERPAEFADMARAARGGVAFDLVRLAATSVGAGLLAFAPALALAILLERLIPAGPTGSTLALFGMALAALGVVAALLQVLRGTAIMRIEGRLTTRLSSLLWDRTLRLTSGFFRQRTAGEVAMRALAFHHLRDLIAGPAVIAFLSVLFLLPALVALMLLNPLLGLLTATVGVAAVLAAVVFGILQVGPQRRYVEATRELASTLMQILGGIGKLRATGAGPSAFAFWARTFRRQQVAQIQVARVNEHMAALTAALPAFGGALLFAGVLRLEAGPAVVSDFVAVYAASMTFYMTVAMLGFSFEAIAAIIPVCEQARPILQAELEPVRRSARATTLGGDIRFDCVRFRYGSDGPVVLHDVSLHAAPGEFIAVVGESGAGKSTLIRLALGLERPVSGGIYYDGKSLDSLRAQSVRRQVGVVVQDGALVSGTVLDNIIGVMGDLTEADAWRAARAAGVERDIRAMPMGMYTPVSESATTLSGGQGQRIRIAASLVRNPRIVFLDEATSWLDASSQRETMDGIRRLTSTRIAIAHRLSTVREANRIYVLEGGRVSESGTFDELMAADGSFRALAERQLV